MPSRSTPNHSGSYEHPAADAIESRKATLLTTSFIESCIVLCTLNTHTIILAGDLKMAMKVLMHIKVDLKRSTSELALEVDNLRKEFRNLKESASESASKIYIDL